MPSKRVIALLIAILLIVGAIAYTKWDKTPIDTTYESNSAGPLIAVEGSLKNSSGIDADNDGLRDWEEALWRSDPNNPDTDGDGTKDGEEIDTRRDPTKKGPNDSITTIGEPSKATIEPPKTETEKVGRELFSGYVQARQSGDFAKTSEQMVTDIAAQQAGKKSTAFSTKNVVVTNSNDDAALRNYINGMGKVLSDNPPSNGPTELDIMEDTLNNKKAEDLKKLLPIITGYQNLIAGFAKVTVPSELVNSHIQFLNNTDTVLKDIKDFQLMFSDPIVGFAALSRYYNDIQDMESSIVDMQDYFRDRNVSFEQSEYGYAFIHII